MKKIKQHIFTGTIVLKSGMRIGGSDDVLQIGGTDLTCIRDLVTGKPYIPGSSLKGKMRSCLELERGLNGDEPCNCASGTCPVCRLFGPHKKTTHDLGPTRIIVRDAPCIEGGDIELKTESTIKRTTGAAQHPRTQERVCPGTTFRLGIAIQEFDEDTEFTYKTSDGKSVTGGDALIEVALHCLTLVQETGLGSGISKGSGEIEIRDLKRVGRSPRLQIEPESQK
ncbi:MAG TPA: type III-A CRISPR-associated RAMP protein Csm3 [bacterium]|nr:type III-A CRISPR-associated RAMP protein Csm3 [bacterium]HQL64032.1 type III-A CRISPR-associated RAMP protein Csm3 [bacterium]